MTFLLFLALWGTGPAFASDPTPPSAVAASDASQIRRVIDDQLQAFERDDAEAAWKHVAPSLRSKFGSADNFLRMVREGYRPVYRPRSVHYDELVRFDTGELGQWLDVTGPDGERVKALYLMEKQADGTWRTSGCLLYEPEPGKPNT